MDTEANIPELDKDTINDFLDEYLDAYEEIERTLVEADSSPGNKDIINKLFRSVHSIKSNLRMLALDDLSHVIHILEDTLDNIRNDKLRYITDLNPLILLVISQVRELANQKFHNINITDQLELLKTSMNKLDNYSDAELQQNITSILVKIDPDSDYQSPATIDKEKTLMRKIMHQIWISLLNSASK